MSHQQTFTADQVQQIVASALQSFIQTLQPPNENHVVEIVAPEPEESVEQPTEEELVEQQTSEIIEKAQQSAPFPNKLQVKALDIFANIQDIAEDFLYMPKPELITMIVWIILTRFKNDLGYAPILLIDAEGLGCGKSTLQKFITRLCGLPASSRYSHFTQAGLRSYLDKYPDQPIFLDEVDMAKSAVVNEISGFLNAGFERDGAQALTGLGITPVYGYKCLAGIQVKSKLPPATISRSIRINMERPPEGVKILKQYDQIPTSDLIELSKLIDEFCHDNHEELLNYLYFAELSGVQELKARTKDTWSKVLVFASLLGEDYLSQVIELLKKHDYFSNTAFDGLEYKVHIPLLENKADPVATSAVSKEFISALTSIYKFKQESLTTKELFELMHDTLKLEECPNTQRKLASLMSDLKFKLSTCVKKTSGFTYKAVINVINDQYSSLIDQTLCMKYLLLLQKNIG